MKVAYDFYKSVILIDPRLDKTGFLKRVGAFDKYARAMFSRMYDSIFSELINLEKQFEKYYEFEYGSFEHFLYKKFNLNPSTIEEIMSEKAMYPNCVLYHMYDHANGDYGISELAFSSELYERISSILMLKKKIKNED